MKKKVLFSIALFILFVSISIYSFAMGNIANDVRNFVGGTENVVENAGNTVTGGVRNGFNTLENGTKNVTTDIKDGMQNTENKVVGTTTDNNNNGYTATRTTGEAKIAGMTTNTWSWIIMGITAAAIIVLVWSYIKQKNKNDIYIDSDDV